MRRLIAGCGWAAAGHLFYTHSDTGCQQQTDPAIDGSGSTTAAAIGWIAGIIVALLRVTENIFQQLNDEIFVLLSGLSGIRLAVGKGLRSTNQEQAK